MRRPRKNAAPTERPLNAAERLAVGLIKQRDQLPGKPDEDEIVDKVNRIVKEYRWYMEAWNPVGKREAHFYLSILIARAFFPETIPKLEKAMEGAYDIVDEAILSLDVTNRRIEPALFQELWLKAEQIAARRVFQQMKAKARARLAAKATAEIPGPS